MAQSDSELVDEVRVLTGYDDEVMFSDSDLDSLVQIGKEELRSYWNLPEFEFYRRGEENTLDADRALFWFTCIATKVRAGEIGSVELTIDSLETAQYDGQFSYWFRNFQQRAASAGGASGVGPANIQVSRAEERSYEYQQPDYGGQ